MQNRQLVIVSLVCLAIAAAFAGAARAGSSGAGPRELLTTRIPLYFTENVGQYGGATRFQAAAPGATVGFSAGQVSYTLSRSTAAAGAGTSGARPRFETLEVSTSLVGANPAASLVGEQTAEHVSHFYLGNDPAQWHTNVRNYGAVRYQGVYPGVDLVYHGDDRRLEYDFELAPGTDWRQIRVRYDGVERLAVTRTGELAVTTRFGRVTERAPVAWQVIDGVRHPVETRYRLIADNTFGFRIEGTLDASAPLVIDPVLDYSTFLGGNAYEEARDIAHDAAGGAWVVGATYSPNFPASGAPVPGLHRSAFVTRLAPNGQSLVYSVFLGGSEEQVAVSVAVDAAGNAYLSGDTGSSNFPTTPGAYDLTYNGANPTADDIFVTKLSPTGTLLYSTYLGGLSQEELARLALDSANNVYVFGDSKSTNFPTTVNCYDTSFNGQSDFFLSKLVLAGGGSADLLYSTYLGGNDFEDAHGDLVVDAAGDAYLDAATLSANFPAGGGPPYNGTFDAVVAKIRPVGAGAADLLWATKLGGVGSDYAFGLAVDAGLTVYVDGYTDSPNFPTTGGVVQPAFGGGSDGFLTHLAANGSTILYSTFLGGSNSDECTELAFDVAGNPVVTGDTDSPNFPLAAGSYDLTFNGGSDAFVTTLGPGGATLVQSTYFGGSGYDRPWGFKIDGLDRWYLTGTTGSADFPVTNSTFDTGFNGGGQDAFVARFAPQLPEACALCDSPEDTCCARAPHYEGIEAPTFSPHILVGTRQPDPSNTGPFCVTIFDLGSPTPTEDVNWATVLRYNGPFGAWNSDSLGSVFGLTLDDQGNIFVTHASCYIGDLTGQVAGGGPGAVYRIDATTAAITTFCRLPNYPDPSVPVGDEFPALGNITYDCRHRQFFVTNLEDGRIYRIKPVGNAGVIQDTFDPGVQDLGPTNYLTPIGLVPSPGWAPRGERLWGVQWHMDRVYYAVWSEDLDFNSTTVMNEIRSVGLNGVGGFIPTSDRHELFVPDDSLYTYSFPVADISFNAAGNMLLGERGVQTNSFPIPHTSRALQYACVAGCWQPLGTFKIGDYDRRENGAGGVDYDNFPYTGGPIGRVWASGDALHLFNNGNNNYPDAIYGYQGFRPTGGQNQTSILIDSDGGVITYDKGFIGDIEAPGCPNGNFGQVCGRKYRDTNHNGVKDGGEPTLPNWTIVLNGPGGPYTIVTDAQGNFCFNALPPGSYTLSEIGQAGWIQTAPPGGSYTFTVSSGQTLTGKDFGNYACGVAPPCVMPPPGMGAWWTFDESGGTTAADQTHPSPAKNTLQLFGGASFSSAGLVGNALHLGAASDYAMSANVQQLGLNFESGSFALDAWLNMNPSPAGSRVIAEKRDLISSVPYRTRGWALYLNGQQCMLEIGTPGITETFAGPSIPAGAWTHVAVSVDRATGHGTWYVNGAPNPALTFSPPAGSVFSNADLQVGRRNPAFGAGVPFDGFLDELEIFNTALAAQSVAAIPNVGSGGKCREYCRVPSVTSICKDKPTVTVCVNIVNNTNAPQSYHWSMAGLPAGPGCTVNGPVTFSPAAGTVTVPAWSTSPPICVTITRPAGLTAQNSTACYQFSFVNDQTGVCRSCTGTIRADNSCWCVTPAQPNIVSVGQRFAGGFAGVPVVIGIKHPCPPIDILSYSLTAVYEGGGDHPDPHAVSLNGLPPGEPVLGQLSLGSNEETDVSVMVTYPRNYDPAGLYQIVMEADTDGDGVMETVSCTRIASTYDADPVSGVPLGEITPQALRLLAMPNPFLSGATIAFTLPVAGEVELAVYDLSGRLVRSLSQGRREAGTQNVAWDGRDDAGRETVGGIYFVRLRADRAQVQTKIVKLR